MKLYIPFYSRVYSILAKMKIKPWVEGNEKVASDTTATLLIIFHQYFFLIFVNDFTKKNLSFDIFSYDAIYVIVAILFLINFLSLQFFGKQVERNKLKDYTSIIIFSISGIFFIYTFLS